MAGHDRERRARPLPAQGGRRADSSRRGRIGADGRGQCLGDDPPARGTQVVRRPPRHCRRHGVPVRRHAPAPRGRDLQDQPVRPGRGAGRRPDRAPGVRRPAPGDDGQAGHLARRRLGDAEAEALPLQVAHRLQRPGQRGRQGGGARNLAAGVHRSLLLEAVDRRRSAGHSGVALHRDYPHRARIRAQPLLPARGHRRQPASLRRPHRLHRGGEGGVQPQDHRRRGGPGIRQHEPGELRPLQGERAAGRLSGNPDSGALGVRRGGGVESEPQGAVARGAVPGPALPARPVAGHQPRRSERAGVLRPGHPAPGRPADRAQLLPERVGQRLGGLRSRPGQRPARRSRHDRTHPRRVPARARRRGTADPDRVRRGHSGPGDGVDQGVLGGGRRQGTAQGGDRSVAQRHPHAERA